MRLLLAVDTITTSDILLDHMETRSWPEGTEAHILSVVEDETVPFETWRRRGMEFRLYITRCEDEANNLLRW